MKIETNFDVKRFYSRDKKTCLVTKFLVGEESLECSNVVLCQHSDMFFGKEEIFLLDFSGQVEEVHDILELLHGHDVTLNSANVEVGYW